MWLGDMNTTYFLYTTDSHDLFYRTLQSHENIPNGIQNRGIVALTMKGRHIVKTCST